MLHSFCADATLYRNGANEVSQWYLTANDRPFYPKGDKLREVSLRVTVEIPYNDVEIGTMPNATGILCLVRNGYDRTDGNQNACFVRFVYGLDFVELDIPANAPDIQVKHAMIAVLERGLWLSVPTLPRAKVQTFHAKPECENWPITLKKVEEIWSAENEKVLASY